MVAKEECSSKKQHGHKHGSMKEKGTTRDLLVLKYNMQTKKE